MSAGLNPYTYAGNNPINATDPSGLSVQCAKSWTPGYTITSGDIVEASAPGYWTTLCWGDGGMSGTGSGDWFKGWRDAFGMLGQWATGTGPGYRRFGEGSRQVNDMKHAPGVMHAWKLACSKAAAGVDPTVTNFRASFGLPGLWAAGFNSTRQFIGSFSVNIRPESTGAMTITLKNVTSAKSAFYHLAPSWQRSTFGPGGNMTQQYTWNVSNNSCW